MSNNTDKIIQNMHDLERVHHPDKDTQIIKLLIEIRDVLQEIRSAVRAK